jgi:hypothetical protein
MERDILKKNGSHLLRERVELRYQFIAQMKKVYPVTVLCRLLGVSRSGFHDYLRRGDRDPEPEHEEKLEWVKDLAEASDNSGWQRRPRTFCERRCGTQVDAQSARCATLRLKKGYLPESSQQRDSP